MKSLNIWVKLDKYWQRRVLKLRYIKNICEQIVEETIGVEPDNFDNFIFYRNYINS